jgi:uncharacterized protein
MKRVALFARPPRPGTVKSRLSPALPPALACDLYRGMLEDAIEQVAACAADQRLLYWSDAPPPDQQLRGAQALEPRQQRGANLGERMAAAFAELLPARGDRAVICGADCPEMETRHLDAALAALERAELALAPSADGGYSIIALSRPAPELLTGIEWSSSGVLEQTLERAGDLRLRPVLLPALADVDTPEDVARLVARWLMQPSARWPRHAAAALAGIGLLPGASAPPA